MQDTQKKMSRGQTACERYVKIFFVILKMSMEVKETYIDIDYVRWKKYTFWCLLKSIMTKN